MIDKLAALLELQHPDRGMTLERGRVRRDDILDIVFPAAHPEIGDLIISDDENEATVFVGTITHAHLGCYEESLSADQRADWIAGQVAEFVGALFADRVLFWKAFGAGGWKVIKRPATEAPLSILGLRSWFVWSKRLKRGRAG